MTSETPLHVVASGDMGLSTYLATVSSRRLRAGRRATMPAPSVARPIDRIVQAGGASGVTTAGAIATACEVWWLNDRMRRCAPGAGVLVMRDRRVLMVLHEHGGLRFSRPLPGDRHRSLAFAGLEKTAFLSTHLFATVRHSPSASVSKPVSALALS